MPTKLVLNKCPEDLLKENEQWSLFYDYKAITKLIVVVETANEVSLKQTFSFENFQHYSAFR